MENPPDSYFFTADDSSFDHRNSQKIRVGIMLDDWLVEAWNYRVLETIANSAYASPELVLIPADREDKTSYFDKILANRKKLCYRAYTALENRIIQPEPDAFTPADTRKLLRRVPVISIQPEMDIPAGRIEDEAVERIKKCNLDVILWCGREKPQGGILNAARYGVWSYHHADTSVVRGGPSGFWETFERRGERGAVLHMVTEDPDNGIVLCRSLFPCESLFVKRNNNECFWRSSLFVPRMLQKLSREGKNAFFNTITQENKKLDFYNGMLYTAPANGRFLVMLLKHSYRMGVGFIRQMCVRHQWLLMYDLQDRISTSFRRFKKIIPPKDRFWADPHVLFRDDTYYIFIEEYPFRKKKGHISLFEMQQSGDYTGPVMVLDEPFHLSYPHVFDHNGTVYMMPETHQAHRISLYQCTDFPTGWKHRATLMDSVNAVDSTLLWHNNTWWLFTNISEPGGTDLYNELFLFYSDDLFSRHWKSHPMNPVLSDSKRARSAGKILNHNGILYRPSQCAVPTYGYGIKLNEIVTLTETDYREREIAFIEPHWDTRLRGVHTLCHENRLTMIDGYYHTFAV